MLSVFAVVAAAFVPLPAHATYAGSNGNIAFGHAESDRGGEGFTALRSLTPTGAVVGSPIQRCAFHEFEDLPDEKGCPGHPSFSRGGGRLAFPIDGRLAVANGDGSGRTLLPRLTNEDTEPAWTHDGKLVFTGRKAGKRNLYIVDANGMGLRRLTHRGGRSAAASELGSVAYVVGGYVRLVKPDGTRGRRLARGGHPDFSPSGRTVVYERLRRIYSKRVKPGGKRKLVARGGVDPGFSPTGRRILFVGLENGRRHLLITVTSGGQGRRKIFDPNVEESVEQVGLFGPAWRPR